MSDNCIRVRILAADAVARCGAGDACEEEECEEELLHGLL